MPLGPGGLDANGIWLYGEDDSEALASDLLNLGMESVSDALADFSKGFTASSTITATNASWPVPTLGSPIVKVTVIGGGGGGPGNLSVSGGAGGTTTFNAGGAGTVSAVGGAGGLANANTTYAGQPGFVSGNGGGAKNFGDQDGGNGNGGRVVIAYLNLAGISTVNITIGGGGSGANAGGRGEVIVEYVAA
jgi:hypothetical protein